MRRTIYIIYIIQCQTLERQRTKQKQQHPPPSQKRRGIEFRPKIQINKNDFKKSIVTKPNDTNLILKNLNISKITYNEIIFFFAISSLYLFFISIKENHHIWLPITLVHWKEKPSTLRWNDKQQRRTSYLNEWSNLSIFFLIWYHDKNLEFRRRR